MILLGIAVSVSGLVLIFPILGRSREIMQLALMVHVSPRSYSSPARFGHIYIGTIGTEGSLESMTTGYVDENWARHHDRWHAGSDGAARPVRGPQQVGHHRDHAPPADKV